MQGRRRPVSEILLTGRLAPADREAGLPCHAIAKCASRNAIFFADATVHQTFQIFHMLWEMALCVQEGEDGPAGSKYARSL
jgi:hypothetical protein